MDNNEILYIYINTIQKLEIVETKEQIQYNNLKERKETTKQ